MDRRRENSHFFQQQYWLPLLPLFIPQQEASQTHVTTQRRLLETGLAQLASSFRLYCIYNMPEYTVLVKLKNFSPYKSLSTHVRAQISFIAAISILSPCFYISKTIFSTTCPCLILCRPSVKSSQFSNPNTVSPLLGYHFHRISASLTKFQVSFIFRAIITFLN